MKMDKSSESVMEIKRSGVVTKSVKGLLNEFQCVYGEKLRRLEGEIKGSQEEVLRVGEHPKQNDFRLDFFSFSGVSQISFGYINKHK